MEGYGVYINIIDLEQAQQQCKASPTRLMRALMGVYYSCERLAACSATHGIDTMIKIAIFSK